MADANFGIFERDVEIAQHVAKLKQQYGYPKLFTTNYAKNTTKHLQKIVDVMADAGVLTQGLLSLQSMDEGTLDTIRRSNIKLEKYEDLASEFHKAGLPLYVDLMLGLPGSTVASFADDLQQTLDRELTAKVFQTELLVNSPMNEPSYRQEHQIKTRVRDQDIGRVNDGWAKRAFVVSTATFTLDDYEEMLRLRAVFLLCENFGALRQVARFVRQETGEREIDFYQQLRKDSLADRERWPHIAFTLHSVPNLMVPPVSWRSFTDEIGRYLVEVLGVEDDTALQTVLEVQHSLLPAPDRSFPEVHDLAHDYAAWHGAMFDAKYSGRRQDWHDVVPRLREYGPARFEVDDPNRVSSSMGFKINDEYNTNWEFDTPVARDLPASHLYTD